MSSLRRALFLVATGCTQTPPPMEKTVWFAGDVHLGDTDPDGLIATRALTGGEPLLVNLEGPIVADQPPHARDGASIRLSNHPHVSAALDATGVVGVSLRNNHSDDHGVSGRHQTTQSIADRGLAPIDAVPVFIEAAGVVAIGAQVGEPLSFDETRGLRVASLHRTGTASVLPDAATEAAVDDALAAGAQVVWIHGTHQVGGVERRGEAVVLWGLGNLVFSCPCTTQTEALLVGVDVDSEGPGTVRVLPIRAGLHGAAVLPSPDPDGILDLVDAVSPRPLARQGAEGRL